MEHVEQRELEAGLDLGDLGEGERALVELAVVDALVEEAINELGEALAGGGAQGARGGFDAVGEVEDGVLLGLRLRTVVAERSLRDLGEGGVLGLAGSGGAELLAGALVEILDERGAVVLADGIDDELGQAVAGGGRRLRRCARG